MFTCAVRDPYQTRRAMSKGSNPGFGWLGQGLWLFQSALLHGVLRGPRDFVVFRRAVVVKRLFGKSGRGLWPLPS